MTHEFVKAWGATDVGRKRSQNQDFYVVDPVIGLFAVADGMGGHQGGELASRMALESLQKNMHTRRDLFNPKREIPLTQEEKQEARNFLDRTVQEVSYQIFSLAQKKGDGFRMGTTVCAMVQMQHIALVIHVGDSRCYLKRGDSVVQLTEDHSLVTEHVKMGILTPEEAENSRYKNVITRAVGMADRLQVDVFFIDMYPGDRFLLCSDGLHGYLSDEVVLQKFMQQEHVDVLPEQLISYANDSGGEDNISIALVSVGENVSGGVHIQEEPPTTISFGLDLLAHNPLFASMDYQEKLKILPVAMTVEVEAGSFLLSEGQPSDSLYIVQKGSLAVYRGEELIAQLNVGDYVGEMGIFDGQSSSASVVALEKTQCLALSGHELLKLMRQDPQLGLKIQHSLIQVLSRRLRNTSNDLAWTRKEWRNTVQQ